MFMKPYDGGGWAGVSRIDDEEALRDAYEESGKRRHAPAEGGGAVRPSCAASAFGPQVHYVRYDPAAPLHDRYTIDATS